MAGQQFVTPKGAAMYPYISVADTVGQYADGKYKVKLVVPVEDAKPLIDQIKEVVSDNFGKKPAKVPYKSSEDGQVVFTIKSKFKPAVFDAKRNAVPSSVTVGPGSIIRCTGAFFVYEKGVSMQLEQVQLIALKGSKACAFEEEDGFSISEIEIDNESAASPTSEQSDDDDLDI